MGAEQQLMNTKANIAGRPWSGKTLVKRAAKFRDFDRQLRCELFKVIDPEKRQAKFYTIQDMLNKREHVLPEAVGMTPAKRGMIIRGLEFEMKLHGMTQSITDPVRRDRK